jgi:hypothetical protein
MTKQRRATLTPLAAPGAPAAVASEAPAPAVGSRRGRRDRRSSEAVAALYARVPASTKRRLDIAVAMTGRNLSDVVTALLDEHVDPSDPDKQAALEQLLNAD